MPEPRAHTTAATRPPKDPWAGVPVRSFHAQEGLSVSLATPPAGQRLDVVLDEGEGARLHFSCLLRGSVHVEHRSRAFAMRDHEVLGTFAPGQHFALHASAACSTIELRIAPPLFEQLAAGEGFAHPGSFCLRPGPGTLRILDAARRLEWLLTDEDASPLLLHAASLEFLAWQLQATQPQNQGTAISERERRLLLAAREQLLSDLSQPPTIAQLARDSGLNTLKIKRGFRTLFGSSVYALFQRERMQQARQLLAQHSVTETAALLGYTNISHFGQAFRKQFGLLPGQMRRRG